MAKRQLNVLIPEETRQQIAAIRARFGLQSDAQVVIYAVNEMAQEFAPPAPFNPEAHKIVEDEVFAFHGQQGVILTSPPLTGLYPSIPGEPEPIYLCEATDKQHTDNAQYCPRCAPAKELEQIPDAQ
jgi:hypothetical protein